MRIVRRGEARAMPWKNGGGVTFELAVWPEGAGLENFDARISMAEVTIDGPFSEFAGVDRTLAVIEGGMRLSFAGSADIALDPEATPLPFPGEAPVFARLDDGPVLDLNAMTRRGRAAHRMAALSPGDSLPEGTVALVARGPVTLGGVALAAGDAMLASGPALRGVVEAGHPLAVILDWPKDRQADRA